MQRNIKQLELNFYEIAKKEGIEMTEIDNGVVQLKRIESKDYSELLLQMHKSLDLILKQALDRDFIGASSTAAHATKTCIELSMALKKM